MKLATHSTILTGTPTISILTTVYNREKYLAECIESVQKGHFQDYEHIIVDDGSSDGSVALAKSYAAKDTRIRVYQNETNLGDYPNRNKAATYAKGTYIKYLDADDMHGRFMVDIMVDAMETHPEAGFGLFDYGPNKPLFPILLQPAETYTANYSDEHPVFDRSPINAIMKRSVFESIGGFSGRRMVGDFEMWHVLGARFPCTVMSAGPGFYRKHDEQEMTLHRADPMWAFKYQLLGLDLCQDEACPLAQKEKAVLIHQLERRLARTVLYSFKRNSIKDTFRLKKASGKSWMQLVKDAFS